MINENQSNENKSTGDLFPQIDIQTKSIYCKLQTQFQYFEGLKIKETCIASSGVATHWLLWLEPGATRCRGQ